MYLFIQVNPIPRDGINSLARKQYPNPRPLKRYEKKLRREHGSFFCNNGYKQKRKVERLHYRIACIRRDAQQKATTEIVASAIGILKITNMLKNRKLAKALSDSALGGFLEKLKSKAEVLGIPIVEAPQFFASSKMCSRCHKKDEIVIRTTVSLRYMRSFIAKSYFMEFIF